MKLKTAIFQKNLSEIANCDVFVLKNASPVHKYLDGKKTESIDFFKYSVVNPDTYDLFEVKVPSTKPMMTQEELDNAEGPVWISFKNAIVKPYRIEFGNVECSVVAESATIVENE